MLKKLARTSAVLALLTTLAVPSPALASCSVGTTNLTIGSQGPSVTCLQQGLITAGFSIPAGATGYFGSQTRAAVASWQSAHAIVPAPGYLGPISRAAWNLGGSATSTTPVCAPGDRFNIMTGLSCTSTSTSGGGGGGPLPTNPVPPPTITSITPSSGLVGTMLTITGTNFLSTNELLCTTGCTSPNTLLATPPSSGGTTLTYAVPAAAPGIYTLVVKTANGTSNAATFTVKNPATIVAPPVLRMDCSDWVCAWTPSVAGSYAYAPADITYQGVNHLFFCSTGVPNITADSVRYINDRDAALKVALNPTGGFDSVNKSDIAACDPEVVFFKGYFYLFYGSTRAVDPALYPTPSGGADGLINVIHVARSASIDGPYQILDQGGTWKTTTNTPKHIIPPHVLSTSRSQGQGYLGSSWPSVVVRGDTLYLWYADDTADPITGYAKERYYLLKSTDASQWDTATEQQTDIKALVHGGEVKYDPTSNQFVMFSVIGANTRPSWFAMLRSSDGVRWSPLQKIVDLPNYSHNVGVASDELGTLPTGALPFYFCAAPGVVAKSSPRPGGFFAVAL